MSDEKQVQIALTHDEACRWLEILDICQRQLKPIEHIFVKMLLLQIRKKLEAKLNAVKKQKTISKESAENEQENENYPDY